MTLPTTLRPDPDTGRDSGAPQSAQGRSRRLLAHAIVYRGVTHRLSVAEISADGIVVIEPFTVETAGTRFIPGTVELTDTPEGIRIIRRPDV